MPVEESVFWLAIILILMAGYYSLVVMPRQREFKRHQRFVLEQMEIGIEVITSGGVVGTLVGMDDQLGVAQVEIAPNTVIRILTVAIRPFDAEEIERNTRLAIEDDKPIQADT